MVESTALEMRHTGNRIGGSNPSLSASIRTSLSDWIHWQKYRHATSTSLTPGIYGDFSNPRSNACADTLSKHAIIPQQQFAYTTGKNASDITLVIDAMDLLHSGRFDGFCLVSSDSDFTRLAARIREQGVDVFGFGEQKTPESFRQACRRFVYTENLLSGAANSRDGALASKPLQAPSAAVPVIQKIITQMESEDGWVSLGEVGRQLANLASDFDPRNFGFRKLGDLIRKTDAFEIEHSKGHAMRIRMKSAPGLRPKAAKKTVKQ